MAAFLALAAALCAAVGYTVTKRLVSAYPPRQLIGPLFLLNSALLLPIAPFVVWHWSPRIALLYLISVISMVIVAGAIFYLLSHGSAAAVAAGQALSPLAVLGFSVAVLPGRVAALEIAVATIIPLAVIVSLSGAFETLPPRKAAAVVAVAAIGNGLLTVLTKLLSDAGVSLVEIYTIRTALAGAIWILLAPPRNIPLRALPRLSARASFVTAQFALLIGAIQLGNPVTVQTLFATSPLMLIAGAFLFRQERPPLRVVASAALVTGGIFVALQTPN